MESYIIQDADRPQPGQVIHSQLQIVSTEMQNQTTNKNIKDLKKIRNSAEMFNEIYDILNRIAIENDYDPMHFAVNEKFLDVKNKYNQTIFHHSINKRNYQLVHLIIEFSCGCNFYSDELIRYIIKINHFDVNEALSYASEIGNLDAIKFLLTNPGVNINSKSTGFRERTALISASRNNNPDVVKLLLTVPGIDVNAKDTFNRTPLLNAVECGCDQVVKLLLTVPGIDINAQDYHNVTALMIAIFEFRNVEIAHMLEMSDDSDTDSRDPSDDIDTARDQRISAFKERCLEIIKLLIAVPELDINSKDFANRTALMRASYQGHHEIIKLLLTVPGIDVNAKDNDQNTALIEASRFGHHEVVKLLLTVPGIDVNAKDDHQNTALFYASNEGNQEVVKLLLKVPGIDVNDVYIPIDYML